MGESQVLNKCCYPPDFFPSKLPRVQRPKNKQIMVRMMLPMSICCNTCGNYICKGTKVISHKEDVIGETYLGIPVFRLYFECTKCSAVFALKTDPQNSEFIFESGATRKFEGNEFEENEKRKRDAKEKGDAMKSLENRTLDSKREMGDAMKSLENRTLDTKREMDILSALYEMKSRHATVSADAMLLEALKKLEEDDEEFIKSILFHNSNDNVRRIRDLDLDDDGDMIQLSSGIGETSGGKDF